MHEAVASKIIRFCFIAGTDNIADIMTKYKLYPVFWPFVEPVLFWKIQGRRLPNRLEGSVKTIISFDSCQDSIVFSLESSLFLDVFLGTHLVFSFMSCLVKMTSLMTSEIISSRDLKYSLWIVKYLALEFQ